MTTSLREPVTWDAGIGAFVVTGFDEASAVLRGEGWSSDPKRNPLAPPEVADLPGGSMLFMDAPEHTRLRRLVAPAFTPRAVAALAPRVASVVDAALDGLDGEIDLLADLAYLVPIAVMAELLDVGQEGAQVFLDQTPRLVRALEVDASPADFADAAHGSLEVTLFLLPLLAGRQHGEGADFISALLAQPELSLDEVAATCVLLLAAGHETTANLIANGTVELLDNPAQVEHLHADPVLAVDELVRTAGPVKLVVRTATADHELAGVRVERGQVVLLDLPRINRDPRRFSDPERLDLTRRGPSNLGFGAGAHFCLGAALARLEAAVTLPALLRHYPNLRRVPGELDWRPSTTFHGLTELPVLVSDSPARTPPPHSPAR